MVASKMVVKRFFMVLIFSVSFQSLGKNSVTAIALFNDRAMLSIDGARAKIVRSGSSYKGVKLISSSTSEAVIEIGGKRETLRLNGTTIISDELGATDQTQGLTVEIRENQFGFFEKEGTVNGRRVNFLVDTGANLVVINSIEAESLGLNYLAGIKGVASTASGLADMYTINLDSVTLGGIEMTDVQAGVIEGAFPDTALLGMTFLRGVNMNRTGTLMTLSTR